MKPKPSKLAGVKQPTPAAMTDSLLEFVRRKFYQEPGDEKRFAQDRSRLLAWVVLWPATWLNTRGVTLHGEAYKQIFFKVMMQADAHRSDKIKYRPAWLRMVLQSHFRMHGEEYYEEAKSMRSVVEKMLVLAGTREVAPDPVRELAAARQILVAGKAQKAARKSPVKEQLNLL